MQESDLLIEQLHLQFVGFGENIGYRFPFNGNEVIAVELTSDGVDTDDTTGASLDEAESGTHDIPDVPELTADLVSLGNELHAQERCEGVRVHLIGLDLGIADGFEVLGMGKDKFNAVILQQIVEPVPA